MTRRESIETGNSRNRAAISDGRAKELLITNATLFGAHSRSNSLLGPGQDPEAHSICLA
jgi:hypothetical protein